MQVIVVIPQFLVTEELVELAKDCIESYRTFSDVFIISVDDSGEYGKAKGADEVLALSDIVITNEKNSGFGFTCNNGFRWIFENVKEDCYIICSNNDIRVNKKTVKALKDPFEMFENVAITGIISTDCDTWEGRPLEEMDWRCMTKDGLCRDRMQDGGLWMSKKSVLEKIGIFDPIFLRGGYEDVDLFLRARDTFGMDIVMNGRAAYWHKQGSTRWNAEKIGAINDFGLESKQIESENLKKFIEKCGFNPHQTPIWRETVISKV